MFQMRFLCDQMLGTLAKWLRFAGYDACYASQRMTDDEVLKKTQKESRVLLTSDKELVLRAKKRLISVVHIRSIRMEDQMCQTLRETKTNVHSDMMFTRCAECNDIVQKVDKGDIEQKVPEMVFEKHEMFLYCPTCKRIYWMGTHTEQISKKLAQIKKRCENYGLL